MLLALARIVIGDYRQPGDYVLDPMCGIGTTLVGAVHLGREAIGVEYEPVCFDLARANSGETAKLHDDRDDHAAPYRRSVRLTRTARSDEGGRLLGRWGRAD
jgi:23S rRNA G2445 N2-methylase RlmL